MKKRKYDYSQLTDIQVWQLVRSGNITRFPANFWNKKAFKNIFRYICLEEYKFSKEEICQIRLRKFLKKECIAVGLDIFERSTYELLSYCFPELDIQEWELVLSPKNFWNEDTIKRAIKWLCDKENLHTREDIVNNFSAQLLKKNKLATLTCRYSLQEILDICFEEYYIKVWELKKVRVWTDELAHQAIQWVLEKEDLTTKSEICKKFSGHMLERNGLRGLLHRKFNYSTIAVLDFEFPGQYKKEELKAYRNYT